MPYSRRSGIIMEKPILSPDFTIEDIHNVKEYNHYLTKDMEPQERRNYYNERGRAFLKKQEKAAESVTDWKLSEN